MRDLYRRTLEEVESHVNLSRFWSRHCSRSTALDGNGLELTVERDLIEEAWVLGSPRFASPC